MPKYSEKSLITLNDADPRLQDIFYEVIKITDCTILCAHRGEIDQNTAYENGYSKLKYPNSKHNTMPSMAVDCVPYPIDWDDINSFYFLAGVVKGIACKMNIPIIWGGKWKWKDLAHYELV